MPQEDAYKAEVDLQNAGINTKNVRKPTGLNRAKSSIVYHFASKVIKSFITSFNSINIQSALFNPYLLNP